jgi:peptide/nickel transport system ATP-binding protein
MALVEIENLQLSIGDTEILRDIDLVIEAGQSAGLVGESGSGKSLTAMSLMNLLPRDAIRSGSLRFDGQDLIGLPAGAHRRLRGPGMGMIFQEPMTALNPVKTIGAQISEGIQYHRNCSRAAAEKTVLSLLDRVGLPPQRYSPFRYPHQLSGGQRQRVVIAIAIAMQPKLLIADEPTTALDVTTQATILDLLRELIEDHQMALLLITHDLAVVAEMVEHISIMQSGEIVEAGETVDLFRNMSHPYSQRLCQASLLSDENREPPTTTPAQLLSAYDLRRTYRLPRRSLFAPAPVMTAVDGVTFSIGAGERVGLVGESGCGKSTLARLLLALDKPSSGEISFLGEDPFTISRARLRDLRQHMQVVFQDPYGSFNPRHKVDRLVGEPLHLLPGIGRRERRQRVYEALESVGLEAADANKFPHEFSGGQRQRIAIARAIVTGPKLIVADEAVSALDVSIRGQILDLLQELSSSRGIAYLFISHDLNVIRSVTDRVLVMLRGSIVEEGATNEVFNNPQHAYTQALLAAVPNLEVTLRKLEAAQQ